MKIQAIKPCMTPEGKHQPGDIFETDERCAAYLVENGYARPASSQPETAESRAPADAENAAFTAAKVRKPRK